MTDDDPLLSRLRDIATTIDDVPEIVTRAAHQALSTRRLDEELAELLMDSSLVDAGHFRAAGERPRILSFATATVSLELQMEYEGDRLTLRGFVSGAGGAVAVETPGEPHVAPVDGDGWFRATGISPGPVRIRFVTSGTEAVTPWFNA